MSFVVVIGFVILAAGFYIVGRAVLRQDRTDLTLEQIGAYGFTALGRTQQERDQKPLGDLVSGLGARLRGTRLSKSEEEMRNMLVQAGMYSSTPDRILGLQVICCTGLTLALIWLTIYGGLEPALIVVIAIVAAVVGWFMPLVYIKRKIRLRHDEIEYELPELIDLLVVSIEAGLSFPGAMRLASDRVRGALGQELRLTLQEQNMGLSADDALANLQKRADTPGMAIFTRSVIQGQALGVSMGQIMRNIAEEMRKRRKAAAEERAQKAPIKMLFPLVFLIFPAMFVVILLPAFLTIAETLGDQL